MSKSAKVVLTAQLDPASRIPRDGVQFQTSSSHSDRFSRNRGRYGGLIWGTKLHLALPVAFSTDLVRIDQILFAGGTLAVSGDILKLKRLLQ